MIEEHPDVQHALRALREQIREKLAPHVLLVDDSENDWKLLKHDLCEVYPHINVDWRSSPETALSAARACRYDLIILDLRLGLGMTGVDVFKSIRQTSTVPIIGLTGMDDTSDLVKEAIAAELRIVFTKGKDRPMTKVQIEMLFGGAPL